MASGVSSLGFSIATDARGLRTIEKRAENLRRPGRVAGELAVGIAHNNLLGGRSPGEDWPPLSPSTLLNRARGPRGNGRVFTKKGAVRKTAQRIMAAAKPLMWTRRLFLSMMYRVFEGGDAAGFSVGSELIYASRVTAGSKPGDGGPATPRRWPYAFSPSQLDMIKGVYRRYLARGL